MFYPSRTSVLAFVALIAGLYLAQRNTMEEEKFTISVEWYDDISSLVRPFVLFYYPSDRTVEMYDSKQKKTFLKRSFCETVAEIDLYIGNKISVFGRELKLIEYLDNTTKTELAKKSERTYAMLKPEVIEQMGKVLSFIEGKGFRFNKLMLTKIGANRAAEFYKEHQGRAFYEKLVNYISSGPVLAMELLAPSAIRYWRVSLGPTDPDVARSDAPNTLRALFGKDTTYNAAHGSDSPEAAARELNLIFNNLNSHYEPSYIKTLCLVKPHILQEGKLGALIAAIQQNNYRVSSLKLHRMSLTEAEKFFAAYKGVWDDYPAQIKHFTSGPVVALAVDSDVNTFREFVGSFDPNTARKLHPSSLRARFGHDITHNAIHCTDLPDDGVREVEFFFKDVGGFQ
ncbi:nucleoside diphosphate kinase 7-like isoform X1 [Daphnia pulex]|uniref:nucleoside diphosphate kinase 7-like isoform X1 n=2 Tax=Daphnia pulex TaxID=6669 RepID=UPI001EDD75BB|nr:nucleoside diphosphate kinase 7-like isoform X1 [Daphnia pulex]